jgi:hypothetical protein
MDQNDAAAAYYARTTTRILNKTLPGSISKDDEKSCLDESVGIVAAIFEIVDEDDDFVAGLLNFINQGDGNLSYIAPGDTEPTTLAASDTLSFGYDAGIPTETPDFVFDPNFLYSIEADGTTASDRDYMNAADATVKMALFTFDFATDWVTLNGNGDVNIEKKNLIVSVTDPTVRASISQLQVVDTNTSTTKYDGISELGSDIFDTSSVLATGDTNQVLIQSTDANLTIAITAGNITGVLYKTQNFLTGDPDNNLQSPITINIYPAS